jgi:hypothetical protein
MADESDQKKTQKEHGGMTEVELKNISPCFLFTSRFFKVFYWKSDNKKAFFNVDLDKILSLGCQEQILYLIQVHG